MATKAGNFSRIINRVFIIFLLFTFLVTTGSFILRHSITVKLDKLSAQLKTPSYRQGISALLVDLDVAENSFQKAAADGSPADLAIYQRRLDTIFRGMNTIIDRYRQGGDTSLPESRKQLEQKLQHKLDLSRQLFSLRKNFDSLLRVTTFDRIHNLTSLTTRASLAVRTDTVVTTKKETTKNSLLRRLKDALHATQSVKILTVRQQQREKAGISDAAAKSLLAQLGSQYGRMALSGQALVAANLNLLTQLRQLTRQLQDIDQLAYERSREATLKAYASATRDLNTFTGIALVAVLVFIVLLVIYVRRAGWAERRIRVENDRAIRLAGQKSEILAIMSHEIRNKLMAINGAVYTMKRTPLSEQQEKKLGTITLASGLVLETINNVLDASKLEQGYAEGRKSGPFKPGEAIRESIEAMRFMAENKNLQLEVTLNEQADVVVEGDSFRLKQVLLNLLSNAIKYTDSGGVFVKGELVAGNTGYQLTVKVSDTGSGIPKNRQGQLFTPYYQAGGQKPGTGLGLYLCRELINRQGGEITLESDEGKGTIISFQVPYDRSSSGQIDA
ncbi:sensor histidine kinase [Mucilaginibacter sp.]|uniref:sensor histidine kinase n=1 Tax=Mucilaginibacter sp. TaxID=1882438 RepID=UPI003D1157E9